MNEHYRRSHKEAHLLTSAEFEGLEHCQAAKQKANGIFVEIIASPSEVMRDDFRSESAFEMKIGFMKQDIVLFQGELELLPLDCKNFFYQDSTNPNPWYEQVLAFLETGNSLCNEAGNSLCRQLCMRDFEGNCSSKSFSPVQKCSIKKYAGSVADLIWFATTCPWDSPLPDLSSFTSIFMSILFEPHLSIQQTFMTR